MTAATSGPRCARVSGEGGVSAVLFAILLTVFMILMAFVFDLGRVFVARSSMQNDVDTVALAAARELCGSASDKVAAARATAVSSGTANGITIVSSDVAVDTTAKTVRVPATRTIDLLFGGFVGRSSLSPGVTATAAAACGGNLLKYAAYSAGNLTVKNDFSGSGDLYSGATLTTGINLTWPGNLSGNSVVIIGNNAAVGGVVTAPTINTGSSVTQVIATPPNEGTPTQWATTVGIDGPGGRIATDTAPTNLTYQSQPVCAVPLAATTVYACNGVFNLSGNYPSSRPLLGTIIAASFTISNDTTAGSWGPPEKPFLVYAESGGVGAGATGNNLTFNGYIYAPSVPAGIVDIKNNGTVVGGIIAGGTTNLKNNGLTGRATTAFGGVGVTTTGIARLTG